MPDGMSQGATWAAVVARTRWPAAGHQVPPICQPEHGGKQETRTLVLEKSVEVTAGLFYAERHYDHRPWLFKVLAQVAAFLPGSSSTANVPNLTLQPRRAAIMLGQASLSILAAHQPGRLGPKRIGTSQTLLRSAQPRPGCRAPGFRMCCGSVSQCTHHIGVADAAAEKAAQRPPLVRDMTEPNVRTTTACVRPDEV